MTLEQPGQWAFYAIETGHYDSAVPPLELEASFARHRNKLENMRKSIQSDTDKIRSGCGEKGSVQRRNAETAFLYQLQYDLLHLHRREANMCQTWLSYVEGVFC